MIRDDQNTLIKGAIIDALEAQIIINSVLDKAKTINMSDDKNNEEVIDELLDFFGFIASIALYDISNTNTVKIVSDYITSESLRQTIVIDFIYKLEYELMSKEIDSEVINEHLRSMNNLFLLSDSNLFEERTVQSLKTDTDVGKMEGNKWYLNIIILRYNIEVILTHLDRGKK